MLESFTSQWDWMHLLVNDGIVGTELRQTLMDNDITLDIVWRYAQKFKLPRSRGSKPCEQWFTKKSLGDHNMRAFASEQLGMIPIMNTFLQDEILHHGIMNEHVRCFAL